MSIKIFIPTSSKNTYLDQIINNSSLDYITGSYKNYKTSYSVVNIHWPEAIFDWKEPSMDDIRSLTKEIERWKYNSVLIYTKHDWGRVKGWTRNFRLLFQLIEEKADVFVHLGEHSKEVYLKKFPGKIHTVIPHPTFDFGFEIFNEVKARNKLKIDQEALVITAPGQIRTQQEKKLLLKTFQKIENKNKVLISTNMRNELERDFPGRVKLKKFFDVNSYVRDRFKKKYQPPQYIFSFQPQDNYNFSVQISAADILFIPRIDLLNTGNVLLGLTFNKVTVGPGIGNIKEQLEDHNLPVFNPNSISSAVEALKKGIDLYEQGVKPMPKDKYLAKNVARNYDKLFEELLAK